MDVPKLIIEGTQLGPGVLVANGNSSNLDILTNQLRNTSIDHLPLWNINREEPHDGRDLSSWYPLQNDDPFRMYVRKLRAGMKHRLEDGEEDPVKEPRNSRETDVISCGESDADGKLTQSMTTLLDSVSTGEPVKLSNTPWDQLIQGGGTGRVHERANRTLGPRPKVHLNTNYLILRI